MAGVQLAEKALVVMLGKTNTVCDRGVPFECARKVLYDQGNSAVRGVVGSVRVAEFLVRVATNFRDLREGKAVLLHVPAGRVRAFRGKLPVRIGSIADKRTGICVTFDQELVWKLA